MIRTLLSLALAFSYATTASAQKPAPPTLEQRLARLCKRLEAERLRHHVPGMALAVVLDGEVVLARGFGLAKLEGKAPVGPETIFEIGSTTKAFTATLVGMLVDDGVLSWNDPVTRHLPFFDLRVDSRKKNAAATFRDLLSHRTGFSRMGVLFASGQATSEQILQAAARAAPVAPFRREFHYNNVLYAAAGAASARAADTDWNALLSARLLEPLGMDDTTTSLERATADARRAIGYRWQDDSGEHVVETALPLEAVAPCGAIHSHVVDMAKWLRLLLAGGEFDGRRLIQESTLQACWKTQITLGRGVGYGLGWFLRRWEGEPYIEHGGNTSGYSAQVGLLPESDLGFVLLMNLGTTPVQGLAGGIVAEVVLGEWQEETVAKAAAPSREAGDYARCLGEYAGDPMGLFNDEVTVFEKDGKLAVDIPGQTAYVLGAPDDEGRRWPVLTNAFAFSFVEDGGRVKALVLHQAGAEFEMPKVAGEGVPEIDPEDWAPFLGSYELDGFDDPVRVIVRDGYPAVDWPKQRVYSFLPPDADGRWVGRDPKPGWSMTFETGGDGRVTAMVWHQSGHKLSHRRIEEGSADTMTVDRLLEFIGAKEKHAAILAAKGFRITGKLRMPNAGIEGRFEELFEGEHHFRFEQDLSPFGKSMVALHESGGWSKSSLQPFKTLEGAEREQACSQHPTAWLTDWGERYDEVVITQSTLEGAPGWRVRLIRKGERPTILLFHRETGLLLRCKLEVKVAAGIYFPMDIRFDDYRDVAGVQIPHRIRTQSEAIGETVLEVEKAEAGVTLNPSLFLPPQGRGK